MLDNRPNIEIITLNNKDVIHSSDELPIENF